MRDYVYPSVYFAYFYFFILLVGAIYFFFRSARQGYWNENSEEAKYRMLEDDEFQHPMRARRSRSRRSHE
jgi:cbb3-type cytochrome oxidase subunit 3